MTFPAVPRDIGIELFLGGRWIDVGGDRRVSEDIEITRGRRNETSRPQPSQCSFVLDDRAHDYSPDNPMGLYFGELGLNTPIRVGITSAKDSFSRTVSSGWGSADVGGAYLTAGAGGSVLASDFNVGSGVGTQSVPVTNGNRFARLPDVSYRNVDVAVTFTAPFTDVTGGDVEPANILLRGQTISHYYMVRVVVTSAEAVTVALLHRAESGTVTTLASAVTVTGLTHTSAQAVRIRAQAEGQTLRAKVWPAAGNEPYGWHVTAHSEHIQTAGFIGVRSGVATANTNALPIVFSYDDLVVSSPRFFGEISSITPRWDLSDSDEYVLVEAAGITQRLGQGAPPVQSTLYRSLTSLATPAIAYWPCEDGEESTSIGSAISGGAPMYVAGGTEFAAYSGFAASAPLPIPGGSYWVGAVPSYTVTGQTQLRFLLHIPDGGIAEGSVITQLVCSGTAHHWEVKVSTAGGLKLQCWSSADALLLDSGFFAFDVNGDNIQMSVELTQVGANIDWRMATLEPGQIGQVISGTLSSRTVGRATQVVMSLFGQLIDTAVGHINLRREVVSLFDLADELQAYAGETALARVLRLCEQNAVAGSFIDEQGIESALVGPLRPRTLLTLLTEAADADLGTLYEPRGELGLTYREHASLYNQEPTMTLDYGAGQVASPFEPRRDDQTIRNDVTVTRELGTSARAVLETGRMSVLEPAKGGAGRYDTEVTVNVFEDEQLPDIAGWVLHEGTVGETRYPQMVVNLANPHVVADAELSRAVLDLDVDDRFVIVNPKAGQTPDTITQLARGFTERINLFVHELRINAAPESPYQVLELGGAEPFWLVSTGSSLNSGVTSGATSLPVATPSGPVWTTDAGDYPEDIRVGGEVMTVTAVTGGSSPQTFTVTRAVNGVVKAHSAGAVVELARRAVLAL